MSESADLGADPDLVAALQRLEDEEDVVEARQALTEIEREGTVSWEQVKAELGL